MKKFPRSARGRRTVTRTVILGSRRGVAPVSESGGGLGDQTIYVASVPGGKADLELSFVGGVAQSLTATGGRSRGVGQLRARSGGGVQRRLWLERCGRVGRRRICDA